MLIWAKADVYGTARKQSLSEIFFYAYVNLLHSNKSGLFVIFFLYYFEIQGLTNESQIKN